MPPAGKGRQTMCLGCFFWAGEKVVGWSVGWLVFCVSCLLVVSVAAVVSTKELTINSF